MNPEWVVIGRHALKNAGIPVITMARLRMAHTFGRMVIVEMVFEWPCNRGINHYAVYARNNAVLQAGVFLVSTIDILVNIAVDLLYGFLDPRFQECHRDKS